MNIKRLLAILLLIVAMMATMLAGCASKENTPDNNAGTPSDNDAPSDNDFDDEEMAYITVRLLNNTVTSDGAARVWEELNKITEAKINVHVDRTRCPSRPAGPSWGRR